MLTELSITKMLAAKYAIYEVRSFVRYCGQWPSLLWTSALRLLSIPVHLLKERREEGNWECAI